jgi:rod shape determining protein RodA
MLPVIGITLPFMSCGGSSTLAIYITLGMVHSIYNHRAKFFYDKGKR